MAGLDIRTFDAADESLRGMERVSARRVDLGDEPCVFIDFAEPPAT